MQVGYKKSLFSTNFSLHRMFSTVDRASRVLAQLQQLGYVSVELVYQCSFRFRSAPYINTLLASTRSKLTDSDTYTSAAEKPSS